MDSPKHCRMGNRAGSLFDSGHNYPGGIKKLYYYNERAEHIFVFCLYRAGAEGEYVAAATCHTDFWASEYINIWIYNRIRVSKGFPGSAAWQMAQKNIVQVAFVRWRGDSKIVEANAEHDFRLKRLIGMLRTTKCAQCFLCHLPSGTAGKTF